MNNIATPIPAILESGIAMVKDVEQQTIALQRLCHGGRASDIAISSERLDATLSSAEGLFGAIGGYINGMGATTITHAVEMLREQGQDEEAEQLERLRFVLSGYRKCSVAASRTAELFRDAARRSLRRLASYGDEDGSRLIAEA